MPKLSVRIFDLIIAIILGVVLFIPALVIAILIKFSSKGPILFTQDRVGYKEKIFKIYKFRTMTVGSSKYGAITIGNDKRITKIGKILRKTKLDEIPQLLNIYKGDMAFVGPRPDTLEYKEYYKRVDERFFNMMPGITGKASIYLSNEEELMAQVENPREYYIKKIIPKKVELNEYHLDNNDIFHNFKIMIATVMKVGNRNVRL
ncbi:sugar transferase [Fusobacterium mortiferum]|uniref:sugar transferase n=1 Tax=Fusobacterium mortiferum TaxID=850 RepID=UPI0022E5C74E|nr:sugar transferase [Fusobacterium mortiferum]